MTTTLRKRIIPVLLLQDGKLVKTCRFKEPRYVGDPINAVKIFNEKEIDEIIILDISATPKKQAPNIQLISELASECFMPLCYGGGITNVQQVKAIFEAGVEKLAFNTSFYDNPKVIEECAKIYGSQAVVAVIDVKRNWFGKYSTYSGSAKISRKLDPISHARNCISLGAGEILVNSIDRDGTYTGYDIDLIKSLSSSVAVPVVALGGAASVSDLDKVISEGLASAAAAGSIFVFHGKHKAVLINVPKVAAR